MRPRKKEGAERQTKHIIKYRGGYLLDSNTWTQGVPRLGLIQLVISIAPSTQSMIDREAESLHGNAAANLLIVTGIVVETVMMITQRESRA